jgi:hypothetical protein
MRVILIVGLLTCAVVGVRAVVARPLASRQVSVVLLLDVTNTMIDTMAPFVWDGSHDASGRFVVSGKRPPHRPIDLFIPAITSGFTRFVDRSDTVAIGRIGRTLRIEPAVSTAEGILQAAKTVLDVQPAEQTGPTPIWDAVDQAISTLRDAQGDKAIIVVTDGMPTGNKLSVVDVVSRALREHVVVHSILEERGDLPGNGFQMVDSSSNPWMVLGNAFGTSPARLLRMLSTSTAGEPLTDGKEGKERQLGKLLADLMRVIKQTSLDQRRN